MRSPAVLSVRVERDPASAANLYLRGQKDIARFVRELLRHGRGAAAPATAGAKAGRRGMSAGAEQRSCARRHRQLCLQRADRPARAAWSGAVSRGRMAIRCSTPCSRATARRRAAHSPSSSRAWPHARQTYVANTAILETELADVQGNAVRITDFAPRFPGPRPDVPTAVARAAHRAHRRASANPRRALANIRLRRYAAGHHARQQPRPLRAYDAGAAADQRHAADLCARRDLRTCSTGRRTSCSVSTRRSAPASARPRATSRSAPRTIGNIGFGRWLCPLEWQDAVIRAAITLKLCTYEETGAIMAAMTTEHPRGAGNASAPGIIATAGCATRCSSSVP